MKKILFLMLVLLSASAGLVRSQEKIWTLEECIQYAIDNNIQIKQQVLQTRFQENNLNQSKLTLLPSINGQASHNFSFNRTLDQTTYQYVDLNGQSNQFYLGGNMDIFNGLQNYNTIRKNKYQLLSSELDLESLKNNISLNIALAFLQILLNSELVNTIDNQLQITHQQIEKTKRMFEAGSVAKGNLLQIEAQAASEELQLINLKNQLEISYLNLTQMLEIQSPEGFRILTPEIRIDTSQVIWGNVTDIYNEALAIRPEIKSAEMNLAARELELKIAQGARSPRISMNHSVSTMYSNIRKKIVGIDPEEGMLYGDYPFPEQLSDNLNYGFGFTLNLPILNGWQVNTNISGSKLNIENSQYSLEAEKKQLYKTIQQSRADAVAALKKYSASMKAVTSMEESFRYTEQKFNVGMVTPVDYNAAKTQLLTAQSEMAQSKYEFIFKTKVLDFYKGIPLNLNHLSNSSSLSK